MLTLEPAPSAIGYCLHERRVMGAGSMSRLPE
jgi:hypothetical protein